MEALGTHIAGSSTIVRVNANLKKPYYHGPSPKILVISGHPSAGKSTLAAQVAQNFNYSHLMLDGVIGELVRKNNVPPDELALPQYAAQFKDIFIALLRKERFRDIVIEGCRLNFPNILSAFKDAVLNVYGEYTIFGAFFLDPSPLERYLYYLNKRLDYVVQYTEQLVKSGQFQAGDSQAEAQRLRHEALKTFDTIPDSIHSDFTQVESAADIINWVRAQQQATAPNARSEDKLLVESIANSQTFNPFYQTVESAGWRVIHGFTSSFEGWERIRSLGVDWSNKRVAEVGCNHGYYMFRIEEQGGICTGYDIDVGAIDCAQAIQGITGSSARFEVRDCCEFTLPEYDIILALSTLHRVSNFEAALENILTHAATVVFEVNLPETPRILEFSARFGYRLIKREPSRMSGFLGARELLVLSRTLSKD